MHKHLKVSIIVPTYNSAKTLDKTLTSISRQNYPKKNIEILIIDGGSSDNTLEIAKKYGCKIIPNPKTDIVSAESLGFCNAHGQYSVGLAPDEVLENKNSLKLKLAAITSDKNIKSVLPSGYKTPTDYSAINNYINEFGDPFSYFMYKDSKGDKYLLKDLLKKYKPLAQNKDFTVFTFQKVKQLPLIELWGGGCMIDLIYVKKNFPQIKKNPSLIPLIFYLLNNKGKSIAVTRNDPTVHYSAGTVWKYLKKIRSRVEFNIFLTPMGKGGYSGRAAYENDLLKIKKYLFIPYSVTLLFPLIDSLYLITTRKKIIYILHPLLCFYTSVLIVYYYLIKKLKLHHDIRLYGH